MKNLESNTYESKLPNEYIEKANKLIQKRHQDEEDYRKKLAPFKGRDDRMNPICRKLDLQLRKDLAELRKEYNLK